MVQLRLHLYTLYFNSMSKDKVLVIVTGLLFVFAFASFEPNFLENKINLIYLSALLIALLSVISFWFAKTISYLWYKLADAMGFIMSKVILSLIFYLFLLPLSIFYRLFNRDLLTLKKRKESYYKSIDHLYNSKDFENPW